MEHRKTRLFLSILLLTLAGCKQALEKPELSDPIYNEFLGAADSIAKELKTERESLNSSRESLDKPDLTAGERRQIQKQISAADKKIRLMEQDQKFYEIRARSRLAHDREVYPARFEKDLPWPDPEEIAEFETNKRLRNTSRTWSDHVPKLKYGPDKAPVKAEKPAEGGGESEAKPEH